MFNLPDTDSPLDFFYRFLFPDILIDIIDNTNLYSTQETGKCIQLTIEQLKNFLAILLIMVKMPSYLDYWSTEFRYTQVANIMPLKRSEQVQCNTHFVDHCRQSVKECALKLQQRLYTPEDYVILDYIIK